MIEQNKSNDPVRQCSWKDGELAENRPASPSTEIQVLSQLSVSVVIAVGGSATFSFDSPKMSYPKTKFTRSNLSPRELNRFSKINGKSIADYGSYTSAPWIDSPEADAFPPI